MDTNPRFCSVCGAPLEKVVKRTRHHAYTGAEINEYELRCPRQRPQSVWRRTPTHDSYWLNRDGEAIPHVLR